MTLAAAAAGVYAAGVVAGLVAIDARPAARLALALLWPLGPLAFVVTIAILVAASFVAFPLVGAVVLAAALAVAAFAAEPAQLEARFIGNMAYAITDGRTTLFTDFPYESGYSVYMEYDAREIRSTTPRSVALITHRHGDHWDGPLFAGTGWSVIGPEDAVGGVPGARVIRALPVAPARTTVALDGLEVDARPTPHAGIGHYSYLVTWHGLRLYFTGDTGDAAELLAAKDLDVAFVSPWLYRRAQAGGRRIDARRIVIYHQTAGETVPGCTGACRVPTQGETLVLP